MKKLILVLIIFIVITPFLMIKMYHYFFLVDYKELKVNLNVGDRIGFNADSDALYLGTAFPGSIVSRKITVQNLKNDSAIVKLKFDGDFDWLTVSDNRFVLQEKELIDVTITANIPNDAVSGSYNGTIKIYLVYDKSKL